MDEQHKRIRVTSRELGRILFVFALTHTETNLKDKDILKNIGIIKSSKEYIFREMLIISMFAIMEGLKGLLDDKDQENDVLNYMHIEYKQLLLDRLRLNKEKIKKENEHLFRRYKEYIKAMCKKSGPNWLFPLSIQILNTLNQKETESAIGMMTCTSLVSIIMERLPALVNEYEVIKYK